MSYCRFSCDDGKSDVYVYEIAAGWVTHVASHRIVGRRVPIGGPHDGETFTDHSAGACLRRLLNLSSDGYHVPAHALKALAEEVEEPPT